MSSKGFGGPRRKPEAARPWLSNGCRGCFNRSPVSGGGISSEGYACDRWCDVRMAEPFVEGWRVISISSFADLVRRHVGAPAGRPPVLAVDGRSSGGKTTLAGRLAAAVPGAVVVGAGRRELTDLVDAVVWVQTDPDEAARRDAVRVAAGEITPSSYAAWMAEEAPFVAAQRAWERAFVTVCGSPTLPHDPLTDVVLGREDVRPVG